MTKRVTQDTPPHTTNDPHLGAWYVCAVSERLHALRARLDQVKPAWIVIAAWVIAIAYAYPGYLSPDAADHLYQSRVPRVTDWHPPVMTWYWHQFERLVRGPFPMLVLQTSLSFWGLFSILQRRWSPHRAAIATSAVLLFPPILSSIAHVGPDSQMAGFFLGGLAFALRPQWRWRALGVVLLVGAVAIRENGAAALLPFCTVLAGAWGLRRRALVVLVTLGTSALVFVVVVFVNSGLRDGRAYPWFRTLAIQDLAGMICAEGGTDGQIEHQLRGIPLTKTEGRDLRSKMCRAFAPRRSFEMLLPDDRVVFDPTPERDDRLSRKRAWVRFAKHRTDVFLAYRWSVMKQLLTTPLDPVTQTFIHPVDVPGVTGTALDPGPLRHRATHSWFQQKAGSAFSWLSETPIYWPWIYALLSLMLFVYAALSRNVLALAFATSGLLHEATLFLAAPSAMFSYSLWMIACTCIALVVLVSRTRTRGVVE
jgi:hypothetical protein